MKIKIQKGTWNHCSSCWTLKRQPQDTIYCTFADLPGFPRLGLQLYYIEATIQKQEIKTRNRHQTAWHQ